MTQLPDKVKGGVQFVPPLGNMVHIHWEDSGSIDGLVWQFKDSWECSTHDCNSVGYLVKKDKTQVVIAQSVNDDQWGRLFAIPTSSIITITELQQQLNKGGES